MIGVALKKPIFCEVAVPIFVPVVALMTMFAASDIVKVFIVLLEKMDVELRVGTESALVPTFAEVMRSSPVPMVRIPAVWVRTTLPLLKLTTAPEATKRSDHMSVPDPSEFPSEIVGENTVVTD